MSQQNHNAHLFSSLPTGTRFIYYGDHDRVYIKDDTMYKIQVKVTLPKQCDLGYYHHNHAEWKDVKNGNRVTYTFKDRKAAQDTAEWLYGHSPIAEIRIVEV